MASAVGSIAIDGDKKRIYEVPPNSSFVVDGSGFRIYTPDDLPSAPDIVLLDVQKDIWSRAVDWWGSGNDWTAFPFVRAGGAFRVNDALGNPRYGTNDYTLDYSDGWAFVLADYQHECQFRGNLFSNDADGKLFDFARMTAIATPRIDGFDSLQTYQVNSGSGLDAGQDTKLTEIHRANFNRRVWNKVGNTVTIYDTDGTTPLHVFDTNSDLSEMTPQ